MFVRGAVTPFRPTGEKELALIRASGWRSFPLRLPEQPFFYPVLNEVYATQIARDWNTKDRGTPPPPDWFVSACSLLPRRRVKTTMPITVPKFQTTAAELIGLSSEH